jgi:hypothetical protein
MVKRGELADEAWRGSRRCCRRMGGAAAGGATTARW